MRAWLAAAALALLVASPAPAADTNGPRTFYADHRQYFQAFGEQPLTSLPSGTIATERLFISHPYSGATMIRIDRRSRDALVTVATKRYSPSYLKTAQDPVRRRTFRVPLAKVRAIDALAEDADLWRGSYPYVRGEGDEICVDSTVPEYERLTRAGYKAVDLGNCFGAGDNLKVFSAWLRLAGLTMRNDGSYRFR